MGKEWSLSYDNIQAAVEAIYQLDLQEEQTSRTRRGIAVNALLSEGTPGYAQRGRGVEGRLPVQNSYGGQGDARSREDGNRGDRGGLAGTRQQGGIPRLGGTGLAAGASRLTEEGPGYIPMQACECCGCQYFKVCRWRPNAGEPMSKEHRGWGPKYCPGKQYRARKVTSYRMAEMADGHPAKMTPAERGDRGGTDDDKGSCGTGGGLGSGQRSYTGTW